MTRIHQCLMFHKKLYLSLLLFLLIFCILGLPFTNWGFRSDDWGNIWHSAIRNWKDIFTFFTDGRSLDDFYFSSEHQPSQASFFCGLYRPMSLVYLIPQYFLFTAHAYGYFLTTIAIHAFCTVLLFHIYSLFTNTSIAFLAALFFGFHPSLWTWLGWISAQTYNIELLVLLLILLLLKNYLDHKQIWAYLLACVLFTSNVFLHEQTFFLPFWLLFAIPLYITTPLQGGPGGNGLGIISNIRRSFFLCLPFAAISILYLITRLHYFPLTSNTATLTFEPTWQSFITRMCQRYFDFITFVTDIFGLTALPQNNRFLKSSFILIICFMLIYLFIKSDKKKYVLFFTFSIPLFSWPALIMHNQPRYYYIALPLFIALVLLLLPLHRISKLMQRSCAVALIIFTCFNALFLLKDLKRRELIYHSVTKAFENLSKNKQIANRAICFLDLPQENHLFGACAQAMWLLRRNNKYPVFSITQAPIEKKYQKYNPIYVTWNKENQQFIPQEKL